MGEDFRPPQLLDRLVHEAHHAGHLPGRPHQHLRLVSRPDDARQQPPSVEIPPSRAALPGLPP